MEQQEQNQPKTTGYVLLTMEILEDKTLSAAEKFVLARITGFDKAGGFYESAENTASALGISKRTVQYARKHLEELGYIETVRISDLGTKLIKVKSLHPEPVQNLHGGATIALDEGGAKSAPGCKICARGVQNLHPIIKGKERISLKDKSFKEAPEAPASEDSSTKDEKPSARFGNATINELLDDWEDATGFDWHGVRQERFATKNLLAKHGYEATKALVRRVGVARRSDDQFAPQIAKPSQLVGKYEKLTALTMWEERQAKQEVAEAAQPQGPRYDLLYPQFRPEEDDWLSRPDTPEAKAERQATVKRLREKYGFGKVTKDGEE